MTPDPQPEGLVWRTERYDPETSDMKWVADFANLADAETLAQRHNPDSGAISQYAIEGGYSDGSGSWEPLDVNVGYFTYPGTWERSEWD